MLISFCRQLFAAFALILSAETILLAANPLQSRQWTVENLTRQALVFAPPQAKTNSCPMVFVFHGHGGSMNHSARSFPLHTHWPEAIVVYPQGLKTPAPLVDPEGRLSGWQFSIGELGDRDLKFFDVMLESLSKEYRVDKKRIYATGHSNGGFFSYLLWAARGTNLAATAPCAAAFGPGILAHLKPKPVMHVAGTQDPLVWFFWQNATIQSLRQLNKCGESRPWGDNATEYISSIGCPVVAYIYQGGHMLPAAVPAAVAKFFKEHPVKSR